MGSKLDRKIAKLIKSIDDLKKINKKKKTKQTKKPKKKKVKKQVELFKPIAPTQSSGGGGFAGGMNTPLLLANDTKRKLEDIENEHKVKDKKQLIALENKINKIEKSKIIGGFLALDSLTCNFIMFNVQISA